MGRIRIGQASMGHVPGLRGFYPGYVPKSGFRGPYGACAEKWLQRPLRGMCQASEVPTRDMCRKNVA